jgi:hypothetical protein
MSTDSRRLQEANICHDDDAARAAQLLRDIDSRALDAAEWPLLAFLLNHVLGEKLARWDEAHARLTSLLAHAGDATTALLWRQAAVAARLCGDTSAATQCVAGLASCTGVGTEQAQQLVALAAASFAVPQAGAASAGRIALDALAALDSAHWQAASALDTAAAASCNNLAAGLSERPLGDLRDPCLRDALQRAALCSQRLWQRCGNWVNQDRACYGVAVAAGALGDAAQALAASRQGLALLDEHDQADEESVDRAFLELEQAFAQQCLGHNADAASARARADALAAAFDDDSLRQWYRQRVERHALLAAG